MHRRTNAVGTTCELCGARVAVGTAMGGTTIEWCANGCFRRAVPLRRPGCPECGSDAWDANVGCRDCGHEWTVRASRWDGTVYFWVAPGWSRGKEVRQDDAA